MLPQDLDSSVCFCLSCIVYPSLHLQSWSRYSLVCFCSSLTGSLKLEVRKSKDLVGHLIHCLRASEYLYCKESSIFYCTINALDNKDFISSQRKLRALLSEFNLRFFSFCNIQPNSSFTSYSLEFV